MTGSGEIIYSECRVPGRPDIVNAGSGETDLVHAGVRGDRIYSDAGFGFVETRYSEC
ncbi:unnamed protein product, partial [Staurois parvus]